MPELPEAEVTTRKLKPLILGKRILNLGNRKILGLERRGKAILIFLGRRTSDRTSDVHILGFHQRMTGRLMIVNRDFKDKYIRRRFKLSDGRDLVFHDVRRFGVVWYGAAKKVLSDKYFRTLGTDALAISFRELKNILAARKVDIYKPHPSPPLRKEREITPLIPLTLRGTQKQNSIKSFLLNQKNLAGIGNIMADEILWKARLHPERKVQSLTDDEIKILWRALRSVLLQSIKLGGSTMRDWLHPDGDRGGYFEKRFVYDREGKSCFRCHSKIVRAKIVGRPSYYCQRCQKK